MKSILIAVLSSFLFFGVALAEEEVYTDNSIDNSVEYVIDTGDGVTIVIHGDGNIVTVGGGLTDENEQVLNKIYLKGDVWYEITGPTEIEVDGIITLFTRIIKRYQGDKWELVWSEQ